MDKEKEKNILEFCRYYRGEKENPHKEGNKYGLWETERIWYNMIINESSEMHNLLDEYLGLGMAEFEMSDGTPITLKAVLLNRYLYYTEMFNVDDFKNWYKNIYLA